jgi:hypothetical protein
VSNQYPGWGAPGRQPMPYQAYPVEPPQRKRTRWLVVVAVVAVVAAGAGVGVWLLRDGSGGGDPSADLPENRNLKTMSFPDPDSFGYADGPESMCAALDETMSARGYLFVSGKRNNGGQYCRFITPGLSLLKDGSNEIRVDVGVWRDDAEGRYEALQSSALEQSQSQQKKADYSVSKVERFPVGDAGFIYHREGDRTDTEAYFRSGGDLMTVSVWGTVLVSSTSETPETKPLPEEVTYREITDIIVSLNGEGKPGPPQLTAPELAQSPALAGTANLTFPEGLTVEDACAKATPAAGTLGMTRKTSGSCGFEAGSDNWRDYVEGYTEREMTIGVGDYPPERNIVAAEQMARDLRSWLRIAAGDRPCGPLYELPFADTGYATYCGNILHVGFVLNGRTYVSVEANGFRKTGGELVPLPEEEVLGNLATVLTAMSG